MNVMHLTPQADGTVEWPSPGNSIKTVVTVGVFDGMHLGHQAVIARVVELAKRYDALSSVILFDPRPAYVHAWAAAHEGVEPDATKVDAVALTSMDERLRRIEQLGAEGAQRLWTALDCALHLGVRRQVIRLFPWPAHRQAWHAHIGVGQ